MEDVPEVPESEQLWETQGQSIPIVLDWDDGQQYSTLNSPNLPLSTESQLVPSAKEVVAADSQLDFEARVIKATGSKDVTHDLLRHRPVSPKPPNVGLIVPKIGLTKVVKRSVSTFFQNDRKPETRASLDLGEPHRKDEKRKISLAIRRKPVFLSNAFDGVLEEKHARPIDLNTLPKFDGKHADLFIYYTHHVGGR